MTSYYDPTRSCVLQVNISHLIYPVTEKVLGQLFDVYGVNDVCLLQQSTYIEAFVEFQSWYEATEARSALHGRCIYDGCCLLDIQHAPLSISVMRLPNSEPVVVDWDQVEVAPSASTPAAPIAVFTSTAISEESPEVHPARTGSIVDKALDCEVLVDLSAPHKASAPAMTDVKEARASDDVFTASTGCSIMAPTSCLTLCLHDNGNKRTTDQVPVLGPAACPPPSLDRRLYASLMPRPLPWPSFLYDGDGKQLTSTCPATQGTWPYFQPKPPWVYSVQALFSEGPKCWAHLYISGNLHLLESCWNFSSPELPLYWNDWFMGYNVTDLVAQKNWDPGGMLQSGCAPLAFPRCFCMSWDPYSTEANHRMEQLSLNKFGLVCKATCTVTHQLDPEILVGSFHVHSVGTLKFVMVRQYFWKVQFIDYLVFGVKEWVQDIQCVQLSSVVCDAPPVWYGHHIVGVPSQVLANASVLEILARELCMGYISADFNGISRVHLPPWLPSILFILEVTPWTNDSDIAELTCCTPGFIGIALTRIVWSVAQLLSYHVEGVHADCHMVKSSKYKMQEQQKRGGTGHSFFPHPWLPNIILVAAQEKSSHSWEDAQGMQTHLFLTQQLGTLSCFVTTQTCELMRVDLTDKYTKHSVEDIVLILTHEQNASLFVVLDARVQWDPGRLWSTMSGEHKTNCTKRSQTPPSGIGARGDRLIEGLEDLSVPWDPGTVSIHASAVPVRVKARLRQYQSGSYTLLRPEHAIAWGQATFCRGGSVTPHVLPGPQLNDGLPRWAWPNRSRCGVDGIKGRRRSTGRGSTRK